MAQNRKPEPNPWSPRLADLDDRGPVPLEDDLCLLRARLLRAEWAGGQANRVDLKEVHLRGARMSRAVLGLFRATDALFEECDLSGIDLTECSLYRVEFRGCRMTGLVAGAAKLEWVRFEDCRLDLASFRALEAEDCQFQSCDLRGAFFDMATLKRVSFAKCRLGEASFRQAVLEDVDLRSSEVSGIRYVQALKGATIDSGQLFDISGALARESGILVEDSV